MWDENAGTGFGEVSRSRCRWIGTWSVTEPEKVFWSTSRVRMNGM